MIKFKARRHIIFFFILFLGFQFNAYSQEAPLRSDQAFKLKSITLKDNKFVVTQWQVANEYYLYKDRFIFKIINNNQAILGSPRFPETNIYKYYPTGEKMKAYTGQFKIIIPIIKLKKINNPIKLEINYQGCSKLGLCYPSEMKIKPLDISSLPISNTPNINKIAFSTTQYPLSNQSKIVQLLQSKSLITIIIVFFIMGSLLSLTPCVLPMIPILSSIIIGQKKITHFHSFLLSLTYVLAMSVTYAILGVVAGLVGEHLQATLQAPWVIVTFSVIFVLMALSLFGFYSLQLPTPLRNKVANLSQHQKHGTYIGTAIMGALSTLILSPCVTPALAGAIIYLGNQGNALLGAIALFSMGMGMGVPLLMLGAFGPKLIPKTGKWMNAIKYLFGVILLGVAIYMLSRIIPATATMVLWGLLAIGTAIALGTFKNVRGAIAHLAKLCGIFIFIYGILLIIGALIGSTNPFKPISVADKTESSLNFTPITSVAQLKQELLKAKMLKKPVLLDFYASWCIECLDMDKTIFRNPLAKKLSKKSILLRADVTQNNENTKALQKHYGVVAPPTILFFYPNGQENKAARIVGRATSEDLISKLKSVID